MSMRQTFRFAWGGIAANKMRSMLTMLGIVIGVASVITLVAVGTGSQAAVQANIDRLGSNVLNVAPMPTRLGGHGSAMQQQLRRLLKISSKPDNSTHEQTSDITFADAAALKSDGCCPDVLDVAPKVGLPNSTLPSGSSGTVNAVYGGSSHTVNFFLGTTANYFPIDADTVSAGRFFTEQEVAQHARVAVVGVSVAADLVSGETSELVGQAVRFNGQDFTVIGILGSKGYSGNSDLDDKVDAPITATEDALFGYTTAGSSQLTSISVQSTSAATLDAAQT